MNEAKVLILGGHGYVGSAVSAHLLEAGLDVQSVDLGFRGLPLAGEVMRWLAQKHILQTQRAQFEGVLLEIAEYAEEWLTSAQSLGLAQRTTTGRVMPLTMNGPPHCSRSQARSSQVGGGLSGSSPACSNRAAFQISAIVSLLVGTP